MEFGVKVTKVKPHALDIETPGKRFFAASALEVQKEIRERTETKAVDVEGRPFKAYTKAYKKYREKKGRSGRPNLSFTTKMLGAMRAKGLKDRARIMITGKFGFIAWMNEERGREWFDLSKKQLDQVYDKIKKWIDRQNRLS